MTENQPQQPSVEQQAQQQTGQTRVRLRIDQRNMSTSYANAFRTSSTLEEVVVELGLNTLTPTSQQGGGQEEVAGEMLFEVSNRLVLSYPVTKRLAAALSQLVHNYEQRFGPIQPPSARSSR